MSQLNFGYRYKMLDDGSRVAILIDNGAPEKADTESNMDDIAKKLGVRRIVYLSSDKTWTYWEDGEGIRVLGTKDQYGKRIDAPTLDIAWEIAKAKYIKE